MKDAELKNERKVFTRKEGRDIIKKDYNPLVDYKLICGREGLYMRKEEKDVIKRNNVYRLLEKICKDFNINDSKEIIENFLKKQ